MRIKNFLLLISLILTGCSLTKTEIKNDVQNINIPDADHEYFEVEDMYINWNSILIQNKTTYYVYIYSLTCTHCAELKNWIIEKALSRDDIFFVQSSSKDVIRNDVSKTIGATNISDIAILGYPSLLKISSKTLIKNIAGNTQIMNALK